MFLFFCSFCSWSCSCCSCFSCSWSCSCCSSSCCSCCFLFLLFLFLLFLLFLLLFFLLFFFFFFTSSSAAASSFSTTTILVQQRRLKWQLLGGVDDAVRRREAGLCQERNCRTTWWSYAWCPAEVSSVLRGTCWNGRRQQLNQTAGNRGPSSSSWCRSTPIACTVQNIERFCLVLFIASSRFWLGYGTATVRTRQFWESCNAPDMHMVLLFI